MSGEINLRNHISDKFGLNTQAQRSEDTGRARMQSLADRRAELKNAKRLQKNNSGRKEAPLKNDDENLPKVIPISDDEDDAQMQHHSQESDNEEIYHLAIPEHNTADKENDLKLEASPP